MKTQADTNIPTSGKATVGWLTRLVRRITASAWKQEIRGAADYERVRDDKWRYRIALEGVLASATPNRRDNPNMHKAWKDANEALSPPNVQGERGGTGGQR